MLSDRTERSESRSSSRGSVSDLSEGGVGLSCGVGTVQGQTGPVGFVIFRTPFRPKATDTGIDLEIFSDRRINIDLVIKNIGFEDTFQVPRTLEPGQNLVQVSWPEFRLYFRGKQVESDQRLNPQDIQDFALQVRRGGQPPEIRNNPEDIVVNFRL